MINRTHITALIGIAVAGLILFLWIDTSAAQDDQPEEENYLVAVPLMVEFVDGDVAITQVGDGLFVISDQGLHAKLDAITEHLGLVVGEDTRPDLNTIDEQELFGIMSVAKVYGARSKAALIWSHIHNEDNTITTKADLLAIAGIGDKTANTLWPLVRVEDE